MDGLTRVRAALIVVTVIVHPFPASPVAQDPDSSDDRISSDPWTKAARPTRAADCGFAERHRTVIDSVRAGRAIDPVFPWPGQPQPKGGLPGAGTVSTLGNRILLEMAPGVLLPENLLDLGGTTIRFTPDAGGFRTEAVPFSWDPNFGAAIGSWSPVSVTLNNFEFSFSGSVWSSFFVNPYGNITFGVTQDAFYDPSADRFLEFRTFGGSMTGTVPIISPLFRRLGGAFGFEIDPDGVNQRYVREQRDRVIVTWEMSEPYRSLQAFVSQPRINRFQVVMHDGGMIEFSYDAVAVEDGIVGVFPTAGNLPPVPLASIDDGPDLNLPDHIDTLNVTAELLNGIAIRISFTTRGSILLEGDPAIDRLFYRAWLDLDEPFLTGADFADAEFSWSIGGSPALTYSTSGPGVSPLFEISGDTISLTASLTPLGGASQFAFFVDVVDFDGPVFDQTGAATVTLPPVVGPEIDLSQALASDAARPVVYEAFYYPDVPGVRDLACAVISQLGDRFDLFTFYTDFRIDNQQAGAVSSGAIGNLVSGVHPTLSQPQEYCSDGQLQGLQFPSYIDAPITSLAGEDQFGIYTDYNRQIGLLSHELGHRWLSVAEADLGAGIVAVGDVHWFLGLHTPVPFVAAGPVESSPMGGGHWGDNANGTFTLLSNSFFVPAAGYSFLDLYLMGLLPQEDVPDFFLIQNLVFLGADVYSGTRLDLTVEDIIAANGPRLPAFADSQKQFNLGFVGIVRNGQLPSALLIDRLEGIRSTFIGHWSAATGNVSTMTSLADDCSPPNVDVWAEPGSAPIDLTLAVGPTGTELSWSSLAVIAGPGTAYDVLRGPLSDLHGGQLKGSELDGAICLADSITPLLFGDAADPATGSGFYYLVRGQNECGTGSLGPGQGGAARSSAGGCP